MKRRKFIGTLLAAPAASLVPQGSFAQHWPTRPIRFIVPTTAGPFDAVSRLISEPLARALGQPVVIDNMPGAAGSIGMAALARAKPDGYTVGVGFMSLSIAQSLIPGLSYDIRKDVTPILQLSRGYNILVVHPSVPVNSVAELVAYARSNPGKLNYASGGNGSPAHVVTELFKQETRTDLVHIPYKTAANALQELLAGRIQVWFGVGSGVMPYIKSGALRALAVVGPHRLALLPEVPSMTEAGYPAITMTDWLALFAPAGTPAPILKTLNQEVNKILGTPELRERLAAMSLEAIGGTSEEMRGTANADTEKWSRVIKSANIKLD